MNGQNQDAGYVDELVTAPNGELVPRSSIVSGGAKKPAVLRRSWSNKDKSGFTGKFSYEESTVYLQLLSQEQWDEIEAQEEQLGEFAEEQDSLQKLIEAQVDAIARGGKALPKDEAAKIVASGGIVIEPADVWTRDELKAKRKAFKKQSMEIADKMYNFQHDIVKRTVKGWKDAPIEFSPEALEDLPREMVVEWAGIILEKSRLGKADAENLRKR